MKLDCVLTACNNNPLYAEGLPTFIKGWNILYPNIDVKIIFINDKIPETLKKYSNNLILFKPIKNISTAFISQYIRLLYPALLKNYKNGILIADIDILPLNSEYFTKNIENLENNKFIYYRHEAIDNNNEIAMCYNVALNTTWKDIFNINDENDIIERLTNVYNSIPYYKIGGKGWSIDQIHLRTYTNIWNNKTNNFISLKNTGYVMLQRNGYNNLFSWSARGRWYKDYKKEQIVENIKSGYYTDYHFHRPYSKYKATIDYIINILCQKYN